MNQRYNEIDFCRCLANYMIIVLHANAVSQYCIKETLESSIWSFIYSDVCSSALPVLFMISGFLLFKNYSLNSYGNKIKRRIGRLVIPYIAWNILFILIYIIGSLSVPRLAMRVEGFQLFSVSGICDKLLSLINPPIDGPLWFIRTLFIYSIISPILVIFLRNIYLRILLITIIFCVGLYLATIGLSPKLSLSYPVYSLLMFFIGGIISTTSSTPANLFKGKKILIIGLLGIMVVSVLNRIYTLPIVKEACEILLYLLKTIIFFSLISFLNISLIPKNTLYLKLKEMSFFAYAGHFLFCSILLHLIAPFLASMTYGKQTVLTLIFCFGGVGIMWIIFFTCKKVCPNILKIFDGNLKI